MRLAGLTAALLFVLTVIAANWAVDRYGVVPVGFGYYAPAAVYVVGLAFTLRDIVHRTIGKHAVALAIFAGAALSWLVSPRLAVASAVAFLASELADLVTYELAGGARNWLRAIAASNVVGLVVDSLVFLTIAFGSLHFLPGQILGKAWMTAAAVLALAAARGAWRLRTA